MAGEFSNLTDSLKIVYPSMALEAVVNEELTFRPKLSKSLPTGAKVGEGIVKFPAFLSPPQNVGQVTDRGKLPPAKDRTERQFQIVPTTFAGSMEIGWQTRAAANSNKGAFLGGEEARRTEETASNLGKFIEQSFVGTASDGIRGYVESDGVNSVVVKLPHATKLIRENHYISIRVSAGGAVRDSIDLRKITSVDPDTRTIYYDGADQTAVANDPIYVVSELAMTLTSVFSNGIRGLVDDGTNSQFIHGLDRTTTANLKLRSIVYDPGALHNLSEQTLMGICNNIREYSNKRPETALCGPGQAQKYVEFVAPQRRFPTDGNKTQGKATGYTEEELVHYAPGVQLKFMISFDVLHREMYLLNWSTFFHYLAQEMDWMDEDSLLKSIPYDGGHRAGWVAYMGSIENLGNFYPRGNGVIRNLRDPLIGD